MILKLFGVLIFLFLYPYVKYFITFKTSYGSFLVNVHVYNFKGAWYNNIRQINFNVQI